MSRTQPAFPVLAAVVIVCSLLAGGYGTLALFSANGTANASFSTADEFEGTYSTVEGESSVSLLEANATGEANTADDGDANATGERNATADDTGDDGSESEDEPDERGGDATDNRAGTESDGDEPTSQDGNATADGEIDGNAT